MPGNSIAQTKWSVSSRYANATETFITYRGFKGHEHYNEFNLIDMNGRVYDPLAGRFLSPDPIIQSPDFTQSYNSYSYCLNNPLKFSDPSGYYPIPAAEEGESYQSSSPDDPWLNPTHYTIEELMWRTNMELINSIILSRYKNGGATYGDKDDEDYVIVYDKSGKPVKIPVSLVAKYNPSALLEFASGGGGKLKQLYGWSMDIVVTDGAGYSIEWGEIYDPNSRQFVQFFSKGLAVGGDNSIGFNIIWITPKDDFKLTDLKGNAWGWSIGFILSFGQSGNSTPGYPESSRYDTYTLRKIGISGGPGLYNNSPSSTTYIHISKNMMFNSGLVWHRRMWF